MPRTILVVPCYNEAQRLDIRAFTDWVRLASDGSLLFVNDGSRDETLRVLGEVRAAAADRIEVLDLQQNVGKAEAVRQGMLKALTYPDVEFVGFWDADLATPLDALAGFVEVLRGRPELEMVIGSRVRLLGRFIDRRASRHYLGRVFATAASFTLRLPVYDTQCGAKLFRASHQLLGVLSEPFLSKWIFDVEIIARYGLGTSDYTPDKLLSSIYEFPLLEWRDVKGSKLRSRDFLKAGLDLGRIYRAYIAPGRGALRAGEKSNAAIVTSAERGSNVRPANRA